MAAAVAALLFVPSGGSREVQSGGTFRMALSAAAVFQFIDPALYGIEYVALRPACAPLMGYPNKPLPAGLRLAPEVAQSYPRISKDRRTYTFTIRRGLRFSDGAPVTAQAYARALERMFDPAMRSFGPASFPIVGAAQVLAGKAKSLAGVVANGRTLRLTLRRALPDLPTRMSSVCAVPPNLPADPEGAKAPLPSPAPYYVSEYVLGERLVMERNRSYRGQRPQHVDRITVDLQGEVSALDAIARGDLDSVFDTTDLGPRVATLVKRYGINRSRLFIQPDIGARMFLMKTTSPLFRNNVALRRALNFAVDRRALAREFGPYAATPTDQYLPKVIPGFRDRRIYPLGSPDLPKARALAKGTRRAGRATLYTCSDRPDCLALAQVLQQNLEAIGLELRIRQFPIQIMFQKLANPREPFDLAWAGFSSAWNDPAGFMEIFDGRRIGQRDSLNFTYFDSTKYNRLFARAERLSGPARYRAYGDVDVALARDEALRSR
jgi:peptide/nickel transport system substrate-binding protein